MKESPGQQWVSWGSRSIKKGERITPESRWACRFLVTAALRTRDRDAAPVAAGSRELLYLCGRYARVSTITRVAGRECWRDAERDVLSFSLPFLTQWLWFLCTTDHRVKTHIPQHWVRWNPAKDCFAVSLPPSLFIVPSAGHCWNASTHSMATFPDCEIHSFGFRITDANIVVGFWPSAAILLYIPTSIPYHEAVFYC